MLSSGPRERKVVFMVQETEAPYAVSLVGLNPMWVQFAQARLDAALRLWRACLEANAWPAYGTRIYWAAPPEYAVARFADRGLLEPLPDSDEGVEAL